MPGRNVILVGFMGAGKSVCGRMLARRLGRCFVETDDMIIARRRLRDPRDLRAPRRGALPPARGGGGGGARAEVGRRRRHGRRPAVSRGDDGRAARARHRRLAARRSARAAGRARGGRAPGRCSTGAPTTTSPRSTARASRSTRGRTSPSTRTAAPSIRSSADLGWAPCRLAGRCPMSSSADSLPTLSAAAARDAIKRGALSPVALVEACLARIRALDPTLQAWVHVDARRRARAGRAARGRGEAPASSAARCTAIPVGIKDIFDVAGMPTTGGRRGLGAHVGRRGTRRRWPGSGGRRDRARQDRTDEFAYRDPGAHAQPVEPRAHAGRLVVRLRGGGRGAHGAARARLADGRLGAAARRVLRGGRATSASHGASRRTGVVPLAWSLDHVGVLRALGRRRGLACSRLAGQRRVAPSAVSAPARLASRPSCRARRAGGRRERRRPPPRVRRAPAPASTR